MPDGLIMPFVENYTYIGGLLRDAVIGYAEPLNESANHPDKSAVRPSITHECACSLSRAADFLREVERLGTEDVDRRTRYLISYTEPAEFAALTEREREVARLMVQRLGEQRDRGAAIPLGRKRKAIHKRNIFKAADRRRHADKAPQADKACRKARHGQMTDAPPQHKN